MAAFFILVLMHARGNRVAPPRERTVAPTDRLPLPVDVQPSVVTPMSADVKQRPLLLLAFSLRAAAGDA